MTPALYEALNSAHSYPCTWVQVAETVTVQKIILFDYAVSLSHSVPLKFLAGFKIDQRPRWKQKPT
ncbi:hypothetical protein [Endozoicomonas sp. ISHI1]|uniref:hypothetical protein n=1 Tax=Endozoicomonas sp. ISHI1 TaxID=2825882 RepID=UPI002147FC78|nr:hypothetical protein [Endozoicomonas sp. ISHI1]